MISTFALQRTVQSLASNSSPLEEPAETLPIVRIDEEVVIEFCKPSAIDDLSEQAHELAEQGLPYSKIAERLGIRRNRLTAVMAHWYESRSLEVPDGRTRRRELGHKQPEFVERLIPTVMERYDAGRPVRDIAAELQLDRHTVAKVVRLGLAQRGEKYVDGRTRSGSLGLNRPHRTEDPKPDVGDSKSPNDDDDQRQEDAA